MKKRHIYLDDFVQWIKEQHPDRQFNMSNNSGSLNDPVCGCLMMEYAKDKYKSDEYCAAFCTYDSILLFSSDDELETGSGPLLSVQMHHFSLFSILETDVTRSMTAAEVQKKVEALSL